MSRLTIPTSTKAGRFLPFSSLDVQTIYMTALRDTLPGPLELDPIGERVRATWTSGDFGRIATGIAAVPASSSPAWDSSRSSPSLDVACGTGNLAIPAARTGAVRDRGSTSRPNLVVAGADARARRGLSIRFDVGDAERAAVRERRVQTVVTMFGAMFAARPERAAAELLRVTRSGGRIAMANWTPSGFTGDMLRTTTSIRGTIRRVFLSPLLWGTGRRRPRASRPRCEVADR